MSASTIHTTPDELRTERFWCEQIDPVAKAHGMEPPTELHKDPGDPDSHLLKGPDGTLHLVVRTDAEAAVRG